MYLKPGVRGPFQALRQLPPGFFNARGGTPGHSNIFCTPIFALGQDETQGSITEIADG